MKISNLFLSFAVLIMLSIGFFIKSSVMMKKISSCNKLSTESGQVHNLSIQEDRQVINNTFYASMFRFYESSYNNIIYSPKISIRKIPITGNLEQMKYFYESLKDTKNIKTRIAHYGDSIILGDVITEYLRENIQEKFGGNGAGFLAFASKDNKMRRSILHSYSDDWEFTSIFTRNPERHPLGIGCAVSIPSDKSWAQYEKTDFINSLGPFQNVRVFYSNAGNGSNIEYTTNGNNGNIINLKTGLSLQEDELNLASGIINIKFVFNSCQDTYFYGISLESSNGAYVDNFPITGNSGVNLADLPLELMKEFNALLNYKLIILNFGVNVGNPQRGTYTLYENKMLKTIDHFKTAFPGTSILIVSVADKTIKRGSKFMTDPDILLLLESQKRIADKGKVAFWNLFESMGGKNSMNNWVDSAPPLALKDYRHFTHEGGKIVADLLFDALMNEYQKY